MFGRLTWPPQLSIISGAMSVDSFYEEFGKLLQKARLPRSSRSTKLTQAELAEAVGLSRASVANIERGQQRVQLHIVVQLAEVLGIEVGELIPQQNASTNSDSSKITEALQGQGASPQDIRRALNHLPPRG